MKTDLEIQKDVMDELRWTPSLNSTEIGVAVKKGIVTLSGTVDTYAKKLSAEKAAKSIEGVKAIAEDIEVKISSLGKKTDTDIAGAALNALKWNSSVNEEKIKVSVDNGWVTLEGTTDWEYQKNSARKAVENLVGVRGINNLIKISPKVAPSDVLNKISAAFHRSATIDAGKINLEVNGSKVILNGTVRSYAEKKDAEGAAWFAPGVTSVENNLVISTSEALAY